jgi:methylenetetrahydrofolate reductase (NADPH)
MKLTDLWKSSIKPTVSFELFPARAEKGAAKLETTLDELMGLNPDFVSVTFGAGGSTREGSYQLARKLIEERHLEVVAYFAGYGLSPEEIVSVLDDYQSLGVENVLVVRGDPPHDEGFQPHPESFSYANELMAFIRPKYDLCLGVAGYPEGHIDAVSKDQDLEYLKLKVDQGAEYIVTNYTYDNRYFFDYVERVRAVGIDLPILPGVMPIYSVKMMENLAKLCGATITEEIYKGIAKLPEGDTTALLKFGIDFATNQCSELLKAGVPGLHIYTMDRSPSAIGIVQALQESGIL